MAFIRLEPRSKATFHVVALKVILLCNVLGHTICHALQDPCILQSINRYTQAIPYGHAA